MKKEVIGIALIAMVLCLIMPASAETLTGNFDSGAGWSSKNYYSVGTHPGGSGQMRLEINNTELTANSKSLVHYDRIGYLNSFDADAPETAWTSMNITYGSMVIATGSIGYQRRYNNAFPIPAEIDGYQYLIFDTWNITGLSGRIITNISYDGPSLYNFTPSSSYAGNSYPSGASGGYLRMGKIYTSDSLFYPLADNWTYNYELPFHNSYTATRPQGLGISGSVDKSPLGDTSYNSKAIIFNATSGSVIASQGLVTGEDFNFTVLEMPIIIGVLDSSGTAYNSSVLFGYTVPPVPTWTPDPNATPAPGYVRTYFQNVDGRTSHAIYNSNINLQNVQTGAWTNYTADSDGTGYIDTLPNQSINGYGTATGYISADRLNVGAFSEGIYEIIMFPTNYFPTPSAGNVTLIVIVNDKTTALPIPAAQVSVTIQSGQTYSGTTGSSGQATFTVPNASATYVSASKSGYNGANEYTVTSDTGPDTVRIELSKTTINPTPTMTPGPGGTVPTTIKPGQNPDGTYQDGYSTLEGQNMLNWLAANGMTLVQLCFLVTILALLGVKLGK